MKYLPLTTSSGLQIGSAYQHNVRPFHDADALALQTALLEKNRSKSFWKRLINIVWKWL